VAAKFAHRFFEQVGVRCNAAGAESLEVDVAGELGAVVALDAITIDFCPLVGGFGGNTSSSLTPRKVILEFACVLPLHAPKVRA
jgi:hypothetical protein